jgi:hypothetical protein
MSTIFDGTNFDLSILKCTPIKPMAMGKVSNLVTTLSNDSLTLRTPSMATWGAKEVQEVLSGKGPDGKPLTKGTGKWTLNLQFTKGEYKTDKETAFLAQMQALETRIIEIARDNSKDWFGKQLSTDVIEEKIYPVLKYPKEPGTEIPNKNSPPFLGLKLPCWKGVWQTSVFDEDKTPLYIKGETPEGVTPLDFLTNDSKIPFHVTCLIQCGGIWFTGGRVSVTWNLKQVMIKKAERARISDSVCMLSIDDSESGANNSAPTAEKSVVLVDDDDSEDENLIDDDSRVKPEQLKEEQQEFEEQEEEPAITPPPAPVAVTKKRSTKKTG